jgi:hypothetical protein
MPPARIGPPLGPGALRKGWGDGCAHSLPGPEEPPRTQADLGQAITPEITLQRASGTDIAGMSWAVDVSGEPVPLVAYPYRQTKQGVSVEVNRGKRTLLKGAFVATLKSGHVGVFRRQGKARLPIEELRGSSLVQSMRCCTTRAKRKRGGSSM